MTEIFRTTIQTEDFSFDANGQQLAATRILAPSSGARPSIISFHGLGKTASRNGIRYLLDYLAQNGISSVCFDFSGNGESTGKFEQADLRTRIRESMAALNVLERRPPLAIVGTSMGAHLATLASKELVPQCLILFSPAAYPESALDLKFDASFTNRHERFVGAGGEDNSPVFRALKLYRGDILMVIGRSDTVVPPDVFDMYRKGAPLARSVQVIALDGCDHFVHPWLNQNPLHKARVLEAIFAMLSRASANDQA